MPSDNGFITKDNTLFEIVTKYPVLKQKLKEISPRFERLNNPLLFNSVAKITTVEKAADTGRVYLREMLYQLNEAIGKEKEYLESAKSEISLKKDEFLQKHFDGKIDESKAPEWLGKKTDWPVLDVRNMSEDPFSYIDEKARTIKSGSGFQLIQKFEPLPLIGFLETLGFEHYTEKKQDIEICVYFYKR
jgi:hypothetical protein